MPTLFNNGTPQRALVVDDEPTIRLLAREALEQAGFVVVEAETGEEAIAAIECCMPDLVMLDVLMPGIDGFSVCKHINSISGSESCTVIMMTGLDDFESIQRAYDAGANDFIIKPINWQVLGYRAKYVARATQAFKDLHTSEARLSHAQMVARLGSWQWNASDDAFQFSDTILRIFELPAMADYATLNSFLTLIHPLGREQVHNAFSESALSHRPFSIDTRIILKDGSERFVHINSEPATYMGSQLVLSGIMQDITRRKQAEAELNRKNIEMEQFIYTVSHDLRSPLVTVKTFLGYLAEDLSTADNQRISKDMEFINSAADRMEALLNELLDMARIGRATMPREKVSFKELTTEALGAVAGQISTANVAIQVHDADIILCGDRRRLLQIWQNLLDNAVKYLGDQAQPLIKIGVEQQHGTTSFYVADNGIGIDPDYHEKIFGIFEQLDRKNSGVGMGLTLVRRIVELYGGRIKVESAGEGTGCCFRFTLPEALRTEIA